MNKEEFKAKAAKSIDEVAAKIDELKAKKESVEHHVKSDYEQAIKTLGNKKVEIQAKYDDLKDASEDKWEEAKEAFSSASDSFKEGLSKISSLFS